MYPRTLTVILFLNFLNLFNFSCKKAEVQPSQKIVKIERPYPGFYDIDFNTIFTKKDINSPQDQIIKQRLNEYFNSIWKGQNLSGGILVARGNKVLLEKYTGFANIENQTPLTPTTSLHVASISKVITSLAILKLVETGKLELNQKVNSILPSFPYNEITVKDLLCHRSGLSNYAYLADDPKIWDKNIRMTNQDVLNLYSTYKPSLQAKPDSSFSYSNTNFALLALIVEKIIGKPFPEAIDIMIFKPLGMTHSYVFQQKDIPNATPSYYAKGKPYEYNHLDLIYGDKNIYTTPQDLFRLSKAMYAPNFLRKDLMDLMFTPYSNEKPGVKNYGLGIRMLLLDNGKKVTYHTGWWHGSNALFIHLIDEKVTIIAIGNKFSKSVYSAFQLTSLFGDYPLHYEKSNMREDSVETIVNKILTKPENNIKNNYSNTDSLTISVQEKKEIIGKTEAEL